MVSNPFRPRLPGSRPRITLTHQFEKREILGINLSFAKIETAREYEYCSNTPPDERRPGNRILKKSVDYCFDANLPDCLARSGE